MFYSLRKFQYYDTVLSVIVTKLYIRSSVLILQLTFCTILPAAAHFSHPPLLWQTTFLFFVSVSLTRISGIENMVFLIEGNGL